MNLVEAQYKQALNAAKVAVLSKFTLESLLLPRGGDSSDSQELGQYVIKVQGTPSDGFDGTMLKQQSIRRIREDIINLKFLEHYIQQLQNILSEERNPVEYSMYNNGLLANLSDFDSASPQEYLFGLLNLAQELTSFTKRYIIDLSCKAQASKYLFVVPVINRKIVQEIQRGFLLLDLKNDNLRKKYDGLKYNLKDLEGIVYDLGIRNKLQVEVFLT